MQPVAPGSTDVTVDLLILDATTFLPVESVTASTTGLSLWYALGGQGAVTAISPVNLAAVTTAHTDGGLKHRDDGCYRLDLPDAAIPASVGQVCRVGGTATGLVVCGAAVVGVASVPTAAAVADSVLDEDLDGHQTGNTPGAALRRIERGLISTVSPVGQSGDILEVVEGQEYSSTTGNLITWTDNDATWPVLTGCTVTFSALAPNGATFSKAGAVVVATGSGKTVSLALTGANSAAIVAGYVGVWTFAVWASGAAAGDATLLLVGSFPSKSVPQP